MNTNVNSEAPVAASAAPVAVAETAPLPLTPVAAAIAPVPAAAPAPAVSKGVLDDFLDADDEPAPAPAAAAPVAAAEQVEAADDAEASDDDETIPEFEDGPAEGPAAAAADGDADLEGLQDLEDTAEEENSMVVIDVFKKKCTDCTHLVPWGTKTHKRCHFSNGNELCPAQSVRIRRYIPVDEIVSRFMAAEGQGDTDRLLTLYAKLKEKAPDVQEEIHAALKAARSEKALKAAA